MKNLEKFCFLAVPFIITGCSGERQAKDSETNKHPNIVCIMCDDHSYQSISAYGHPLSKLAPTPNIDRLANEGMIFQKAFVGNSLLTPSRACLMTGLYSYQNGQWQLAEGIEST